MWILWSGKYDSSSFPRVAHKKGIQPPPIKRKTLFTCTHSHTERHCDGLTTINEKFPVTRQSIMYWITMDDAFASLSSYNGFFLVLYFFFFRISLCRFGKYIFTFFISALLNYEYGKCMHVNWPEMANGSISKRKNNFFSFFLSPSFNSSRCVAILWGFFPFFSIRHFQLGWKTSCKLLTFQIHNFPTFRFSFWNSILYNSRYLMKKFQTFLSNPFVLNEENFTIIENGTREY